MNIKVPIGNSASDSEMFLEESQMSKGLMDPENMQSRSAVMKQAKQSDNGSEANDRSEEASHPSEWQEGSHYPLLFSAAEMEEAAQVMQKIMSKPQKKTRLFDMAGKIELDLD